MFNEAKAGRQDCAGLSYLMSAERLSLLCGGLSLTEVVWGCGGVLGLYRGYLDLRSPLEITPLHWSVYSDMHTTPITTEITTIKQRSPADIGQMSPSWGLLSLVIFPAGPAGAALKVFCHLLNKQRSWWPLLHSTELSDIYNIFLHNYNYINTLIQ